MAFCTTCGAQNEESSLFCANCGSKMKGSGQQSADKSPPPQSNENSYVDKSQIVQSQGYFDQQQGYNQHGYQPDQMGIRQPKTGWLTFVIAINWIIVVLFVLGGLLLFVIWVNEPTSTSFEEDQLIDRSVYLIFAIIFFTLAALILWLIKGLNKYNNTARIISIVFSAFGMLSGFTPFNPFSLAINGLILYALAFEQETIALFKPEQRLRNQQTIY